MPQSGRCQPTLCGGGCRGVGMSNTARFINFMKTPIMQYTNYKQLDIYQSAMELFLNIHPLSLKLPKFEMYELGGQVRRSADGVVSNIVEGYGRRKYKAEFVRFLIFSHSSCLETQNHIEKLIVLYPDYEENFKKLHSLYNYLGISIFKYISYVEKNWKS
jgi:four helix bundle protein